MDIWVLNRDFETLGMIDSYESFIWTSRYYGAGDFELIMPLQLMDKEVVKKDNYITIRQNETRLLQDVPDECKGYSNWSRLMVIETLEITTDVEEGDKITITGRSLASLIQRRVVWDGWYAGNEELSDLVFHLLNFNAIDPQNPKRRIPRLKCRKRFSTETRVGDVFVWGENLYDYLAAVMEEHEYGFDVLLLEMPPESTEKYYLYFDFYQGIDRSFKQTERPYVVFSPKYDNFLSSKSIESDVDLKNACRIIGANVSDSKTTGIANLEYATDDDIVSLFEKYESESLSELSAPIPEKTVSPRNVTGDPVLDEYLTERYHTYVEGPEEGLDRREICVESNTGLTSPNASPTGEQIQLTREEYLEILQSEAKTELGEHKTRSAYEGEIEAEIQFIYGRDFDLGDIVQVVNGYGVESRARVIEVVNSFDHGGHKLYPTFMSIEEEDEEDTDND